MLWQGEPSVSTPTPEPSDTEEDEEEEEEEEVVCLFSYSSLRTHKKVLGYRRQHNVVAAISARPASLTPSSVLHLPGGRRRTTF